MLFQGPGTGSTVVVVTRGGWVGDETGLGSERPTNPARRPTAAVLLKFLVLIKLKNNLC